MNLFKHRHFQSDIIIWAVRWYCKYGVRYPELEDMLSERGVEMASLRSGSQSLPIRVQCPVPAHTQAV